MAEKEHIEREAAVDAILHLVPKVDDDGYCWVIRGDAAMAIDSIHAADVRPVVRASWEEKEKDGVWWYACSVCGEHIPKGRWGQEWHSNFCPNCGAMMEES